jgi:hypothetical protein
MLLVYSDSAELSRMDCVTREGVFMDVKITVEVDGRVVQQDVKQVSGTLEQMEEAIDAMTRQAACSALQASIDAVPGPRPLFRKRAENCATKATRPGR